MIVTLNIKKILKIVDFDNRNYIIFVEIVSFTSETMLSLLIVKDSQILDK